MSRFVTSNSAYGSYTRSGNSQLRPPSTMQIEQPVESTSKVVNRREIRPDVSPQPRRNPPIEDSRPKGLVNMRNTCYINSVLQLLFEILQLPINDQTKPISNTFMRLGESHASTDLYELKERLEHHLVFIKGHHQQDAQQFFTGLLEVLNQENRRTVLNKKSVVIQEPKVDLTVKENWGRFCKQMELLDSTPVLGQFSGENYLQLKCKWNHSKYRFERFVTLTLALPEKGGPFQLSELLERYFGEEHIEGVECQTCRKPSTARRNVRLYNEPKVLVLHLNRFQQGYYSNIKNKSSVRFDRTLTLSKNMLHPDKQKQQIKYQLVGTINHVGSINAGHYYAVKSAIINDEQRWFICNDEIIRETTINEEGNTSEYAYILMYRRL